jgi:hypothetical protein
MPNNNTTVSKIGFRVFSRGVFLPSASKEESTCQNPPGESIVGSTPNASFTKNGSKHTYRNNKTLSNRHSSNRGFASSLAQSITKFTRHSNRVGPPKVAGINQEISHLGEHTKKKQNTSLSKRENMHGLA